MWRYNYPWGAIIAATCWLAMGLFITVPAWAVSGNCSGTFTSGSAAGGGLTCTTSDDSAIVSQDTGSSDSTIDAAGQWRGQKFTISSTTRVTAIIVSVRDVSGAGDCVFSIYNNTSNLPTTEVSGTSVTVSNSAIGESFSNIEFALSSPVELSAGTYHVVGRGSGVSASFAWAYATGDPYASNSSSYSSDSGSNWTENTGGDAGVDRRFILMGCQ